MEDGIIHSEGQKVIVQPLAIGWSIITKGSTKDIICHSQDGPEGTNVGPAEFLGILVGHSVTRQVHDQLLY